MQHNKPFAKFQDVAKLQAYIYLNEPLKTAFRRLEVGSIEK
jgi:hypothetical protein